MFKRIPYKNIDRKNEKDNFLEMVCTTPHCN